MADASTDPIERATAALAAGWFEATDVAMLGQGHINDTYQVTAAGRFVLQRINSFVFADPHLVMHNVGRVTEHIESKVRGWVPELIPSASGELFYDDPAGGVWRLTRFVEQARARQKVENPHQAAAAGAAFARFQNLLYDLPPPLLTPTIRGFLRLGHYLDEWHEVAAGADSRWHAFIAERTDLAERLTAANAYVHGDCKISNLLFHADRDKVRCVLDLDTVMRGHWAWDFGDLVRSTALADGGFSIDLFREIVKGFVSESVQDLKYDDLLVAPRYVSLMLGVRYLTDHLRGDAYFRVARPGQNLQRAEQQFGIVQDLERVERNMLGIVRTYV
jgi:Ser/Thr protein kinase RdoA (MazF antagonist)